MNAPPATQELLGEAVDLAREAGEFTLEHFRSVDLEIIRKHDGTPVTVADQGAERLLRERIAAAHPDDSVAGEEEDDTHGTSGRTWIIDPIDGTKAFTHGVPLYSGLLAVTDEHGPLIGVINLPGLSETVYAGRGLGCFCNGEPVHVNDCTDLSDSYLMTSGFGGAWRIDQIAAVLDAGVTVRTWGDGYGYALVATGQAEAMVDPIAAVWDLGPMPVILSEAGGRFTSLEGLDGFDHGSGIATNGRNHQAWLDLLA
ncbi:MAG TPA: inositol monophosphatase family protein [Acidimicrobiales bacterium]|nr:inositol monophosphatase family protein [Acidimicrobiales bacterium]